MREFDFIHRHIAPLVTAPGAARLLDDVAMLSPVTGPRIVTTDLLVENVHFLATDPLETVARKLVRVNVSDILAKGARPHEALLSVVWPPSCGEADAAAFSRGLGEDLEHWGISLIGGDTTGTPGPLVLSLTLTGLCESDGPVRRSGAAAGDLLFVTGQIGAGWLGLRAARGEIDAPSMLEAYRVPQLPCLEVAGLVARHARGAMDVSDGLLGDALKLAAASRAGVEIALDRVPFAQTGASLGARLSMATGGDDYQVLMAVAREAEAALMREAVSLGIGLERIGALVAEPGLRVRDAGRPVELPEMLSFEHQG